MADLKQQIATREVNADDVDDIIGVAAEIHEEVAEKLTVEELQEVGKELDIAPEAIERAIETLQERREAAARAEAEAQAKRKKRRLYLFGALAVLALVLVIMAIVGRSSLRSALDDVEERRAQVQNVLERQTEVEERYQGVAITPGNESELSGARNRVFIERRRYDEAATAYNSAADGFLAGLWRSLFGLPDSVPLSAEIETW